MWFEDPDGYKNEDSYLSYTSVDNRKEWQIERLLVLKANPGLRHDKTTRPTKE